MYQVVAQKRYPFFLLPMLFFFAVLAPLEYRSKILVCFVRYNSKRPARAHVDTFACVLLSTPSQNCMAFSELSRHFFPAPFFPFIKPVLFCRGQYGIVS